MSSSTSSISVLQGNELLVFPDQVRRIKNAVIDNPTGADQGRPVALGKAGKLSKTLIPRQILVTNKYVGVFGNNVATQFAVAHNLNSYNLVYNVWYFTGGQWTKLKSGITVKVVTKDTLQLTLDFAPEMRSIKIIAISSAVLSAEQSSNSINDNSSVSSESTVSTSSQSLSSRLWDLDTSSQSTVTDSSVSDSSQTSSVSTQTVDYAGGSFSTQSEDSSSSSSGVPVELGVRAFGINEGDAVEPFGDWISTSPGIKLGGIGNDWFESPIGPWVNAPYAIVANTQPTPVVISSKTLVLGWNTVDL